MKRRALLKGLAAAAVLGPALAGPVVAESATRIDPRPPPQPGWAYAFDYWDVMDALSDEVMPLFPNEVMPLFPSTPIEVITFPQRVALGDDGTWDDRG